MNQNQTKEPLAELHGCRKSMILRPICEDGLARPSSDDSSLPQAVGESALAQMGPKGRFYAPKSSAIGSKGILLINKAAGSTSFHIVSLLRKLTGIEKIGHSGTLDPFATGVMVMLIGKDYTRRSNEFLNSDKEYKARLKLGSATDTYDLEGAVVSSSDRIPTLSEVVEALQTFQGEILQIPPMFSAKKVEGQKLCDLARKGIVIERAPVKVRVETQLVSYQYPFLDIYVRCSKGTYIRSLANDLGQMLNCYGHLFELARTRSGMFHLGQCIPQAHIKDPAFPFTSHLIQL